jgi:hypothetical protein
MMASLVAFCVVLVIILSVIVALGMAVECLRRLADRWPPVPTGSRSASIPPTFVRSEVPLACRQPEYGDERPRMVVTRDGEHAPELADETPEAPRSAVVLPLVRKRVRARPPLRFVRPDHATRRTLEAPPRSSPMTMTYPSRATGGSGSWLLPRLPPVQLIDSQKERTR